MPTDPETLKTQLSPVFQKHQETLVFGYLFGSRATGEERDRSDIDLAVFVRNPHSFSFSDKLMLHGDFCRHLQRNDIDLIIINQIQNLVVRDEIIRGGIILWDNDPVQREEFELRVQHSAIDFKEQRKKEMGI
ncbi:MAG: nucleotidyltransferase domain-containing protein [Pseudomonadota bacterium]